MVKARVPDIGFQRKKIEMYCSWLREITDTAMQDRAFSTIELKIVFTGGVLNDAKMSNCVTDKPMLDAALREQSRSQA